MTALTHVLSPYPQQTMVIIHELKPENLEQNQKLKR